ncbi:hypothetical protein TEQG_00989 [Trichophyton equinum CBS 127.97]|uniref:Uncharacterized protein n=1 Tax=Trichophyton equinum (strain ATCC MYA-4606 / CBS 127.97) TaxID=559882 RepID=F2PJ81_TRIEC|nr:hypothetical protein TEQG_00989 [Trichophyton equinum CBS 127.97]
MCGGWRKKEKGGGGGEERKKVVQVRGIEKTWGNQGKKIEVSAFGQVKKRGGSGKAEKAIRKPISTAPGIGYGHPFLEAPGETLLPLGPGQSQTRAKGRARAKRWTGNEGEEQARLDM